MNCCVGLSVVVALVSATRPPVVSSQHLITLCRGHYAQLRAGAWRVALTRVIPVSDRLARVESGLYERGRRPHHVPVVIRPTYTTISVIARVTFRRKSGIRFEGRTENSRFTVALDRRHAWYLDRSPGEPPNRLAGSPEVILGSIAGVTSRCCDFLSGLLLPLRADDPFYDMTTLSPTVQIARVYGRSAYGVEGQTDVGRRTVWIDRRSYLVLRVVERNDLARVIRAIDRATNSTLGSEASALLATSGTELVTHEIQPLR